jgi:hypothetical protein
MIIMKKQTLFILLLLTTTPFFAQDELSVEESLWGIQAGFTPFGVQHELKLSNRIALRSDLGFVFAPTFGKFTGSPLIQVGPKYYYNFKRRSEKNKEVRNNSGNFVSLNLIYSVLEYEALGFQVFPQLSLVPMYGLRRNISNHFNFEFATGLGYGVLFQEVTRINPTTNETYTERDPITGAVFSLRMGVAYLF